MPISIKAICACLGLVYFGGLSLYVGSALAHEDGKVVFLGMTGFEIVAMVFLGLILGTVFSRR